MEVDEDKLGADLDELETEDVVTDNETEDADWGMITLVWDAEV